MPPTDSEVGTGKSFASEVARTVADAAEVDAEIADLLRVMS